MLLKAIDKVEERTKISVREYVGFGVIAPAALGYFQKDGAVYVGEMNAENKLHGRGIEISPYGIITIGYSNNGRSAPGNYIDIYPGGDFIVGERFMEDGRMLGRGTKYRTDGTIEKFDY